MIYKRFVVVLLIQVLVLAGTLTVLAFGIVDQETYWILGAVVLSIILTYRMYRYVTRRFQEMDDFFEAVKYRDFSRTFSEKHGPQDIKQLHAGFNLINRTFREINSDKEIQFTYLQKILQMVDVGIIAYDLNSGKVLWSNDSFCDLLDFPAFKNVSFVASRRKQLYHDLFETYHQQANTINVQIRSQNLKMLVSDTVFNVEDGSFKLIVLQNIDETLDKNESEAWKKLLSVMTHEIMNSIAPISSLAETMQHQLHASAENPSENPIDFGDFKDATDTIRKRSEGLLKFAKTYRSLNKVTHINRSPVKIASLFKSLDLLMRPTLETENIKFLSQIEPPNLTVSIDSYLIEQVLINLLLNAKDACVVKSEPEISITAVKTIQNEVVIEVADNGEGIPEDIIETIFVPFFSTKKNGSGIGLALCKQIMLLHNGKISVNSILGKGTVVSLRFSGHLRS